MKRSPLNKFHNLTFDAEDSRVIDVNRRDFDHIIRHFGQVISQPNLFKSNTLMSRSPARVATPLPSLVPPVSGPTPVEAIAVQALIGNRLPWLAKIALIGWGISNFVLLTLWTFHLI